MNPTAPTEPATTPAAPTPSPAEAPPPAAPPPTFEQRVDDFGRRAGAAGEKLGKEAEAAAERWSKDPGVAAAGDTLARVWGLVLLAIGLWFFADFTLGLDLPGIAWGELWPLVIIVLGLAVLVRGLATRRT
jgi:hypothetical protein